MSKQRWQNTCFSLIRRLATLSLWQGWLQMWLYISALERLIANVVRHCYFDKADCKCGQTLLLWKGWLQMWSYSCALERGYVNVGIQFYFRKADCKFCFNKADCNCGPTVLERHNLFPSSNRICPKPQSYKMDSSFVTMFLVWQFQIKPWEFVLLPSTLW